MNRIIGTSVGRLDAPAKATGRAKYAADYTVPGMLHVALARAQAGHARIRDIRVPKAPEGVYCFTAKDLPRNVLPSVMNDQPVLAEDVIRFWGEPFAVVAAGTREAAEAFAASLEIDLEALPLVEDPEEALREDAPKLFEKGNLCSEFHSLKGDPEAAFRACPVVEEDTFFLPAQCHGFLEPEAAFTQIDGKGRLSLISSTQNAFADRRTIMHVLDLPEEKVVSRAAAVGGGFGGKDGNTAQIFPAIVTHFTGRPAKYAFTREENIRTGMKRHGGKAWVRIGLDENGVLRCMEGRMWLDTGAYAILGPAVLGLGMEHLTGPYHIPDVRLDGWLAYTNHAPASAMRGFGAPQGAMATESLLNRAAERLGIDPLEIRLRNAIHRGQRFSMGAEMEHSVGFEEALRLFEKSDFYREMKTRPEPGAGYGIAAGMMSSGMGKHVPDTAVAEIEAGEDGTYTVRIGLVDIGQGSETLLAMVAAEALGVPLDRIRMRMGDTDEAEDSGSTAASRSTYVCGNAILLAAERIRGGEKRARAAFDFPEIRGEDGVHSIFGFIVQGVKVRVDRCTGAVTVADVHNVTEAGTVLHPEMMAGQIFGGIVMSEGYALSEEMRWRNGRTLEDGFNSYIMPTALDAPRLTNENVPFAEETGPYGAKGVAEAATVAMAPAIAAAVGQILPGIRIVRLPIDRMEILRRLKEEER